MTGYRFWLQSLLWPTGLPGFLKAISQTPKSKKKKKERKAFVKCQSSVNSNSLLSNVRAEFLTKFNSVHTRVHIALKDSWVKMSSILS